MKQTVHFHDFQNAFSSIAKHRGQKNSFFEFSYEGLKALYEGLINYEEECETEIELDVISLCQEYTEFENFKDFQDNYDNEIKTLEEIEDHTIIFYIPESEGFIIQNF